MKESSFWKYIKKYLPGEVERVENSVGEGMPDVCGTWRGVDYWIELKTIDKELKSPFWVMPNCEALSAEAVENTKNIRKLLRYSQIIWHSRRSLHGALVYVLVRGKTSFALSFLNSEGLYCPCSPNIGNRGQGQYLLYNIKKDLLRRNKWKQTFPNK